MTHGISALIRDKVISISVFIKKKRNIKAAITQLDDDMSFADLQAFSTREFTRKSSNTVAKNPQYNCLTV